MIQDRQRKKTKRWNKKLPWILVLFFQILQMFKSIKKTWAWDNPLLPGPPLCLSFLGMGESKAFKNAAGTLQCTQGKMAIVPWASSGVFAWQCFPVLCQTIGELRAAEVGGSNAAQCTSFHGLTTDKYGLLLPRRASMKVYIRMDANKPEYLSVTRWVSIG